MMASTPLRFPTAEERRQYEKVERLRAHRGKMMRKRAERAKPYDGPLTALARSIPFHPSKYMLHQDTRECARRAAAWAG